MGHVLVATHFDVFAASVGRPIIVNVVIVGAIIIGSEKRKRPFSEERQIGRP